ncbi:MAG: HNH endonuclease [Candidatus Doudnabacteria bacterium]|nr:HNH endonuclease [Candidatus Doudnabacteria bacterium]
MSELPTPDSTEFNNLVRGKSERGIYRVLYEHRGQALTMAEIRQTMGLEAGEQEHLNRRMRELYRVFIVERTRRGTETLYQLVGKRDHVLNTDGISMKVRALILKDQRCAQCGRTPMEDHVKLHVDHKIPQEWGGTNDPDNLQPLCSDCNEGKRNFYATYDEYADKIKEAANYDEPHRRIGELLKAFKGEFVRPDLIEIVANSKQYQDDWQKRLRELRTLGWVIDVDKRKEGKRFVAYYAAKHFEPWPNGSIRSEITRLEVLRKPKK